MKHMVIFGGTRIISKREKEKKKEKKNERFIKHLFREQ